MNSEVQVTINDLSGVIAIIDTAAQRGAFKGEELSTVGKVRDKISAFIKAATETTEAPAVSETTEQGE